MSFINDAIEYYRRHGAHGGVDPRLEVPYVLSLEDLRQHGVRSNRRRSPGGLSSGFDVNPRPVSKGRRSGMLGNRRNPTHRTPPQVDKKKLKTSISPAKKVAKSTPEPTPEPGPVHRNFLPSGGDPYSNLQDSGQAMEGHDDHEVPVMPPPRKVVKIHNDYFTVNLPFVVRLSSIDASVYTISSNTRPVFTWRCNSIYDPLKEIRTDPSVLPLDPTGYTLGDARHDSDIQPMGRDIWASHYKYYRVLHSEINVSVVSSCHGTSQLDTGVASPFKNKFCYGYELTDEDGKICDDVDAFLCTKRAKRKMLEPCDVQTTSYWNGTVAVTQQRNLNVSNGAISYKYTPRSWKHHVEEAGVEERWTPINQNPGIDHELHFRMFHMTGEANPSGRFSFLITGYYQVQFRECEEDFFKRYSGNTASYGGAGEDAIDD